MDYGGARRQQNDMRGGAKGNGKIEVEGPKDSNTLPNFSANDRLFALLLARLLIPFQTEKWGL